MSTGANEPKDARALFKQGGKEAIQERLKEARPYTPPEESQTSSAKSEKSGSFSPSPPDQKPEDGNKSEKSGTLSTSPPSDQLVFRPEGIYYLTVNGHFLVDIGPRFRRYSKKTPVANGLFRYLLNAATEKPDEDGIKALHKQALAELGNCEIDNAVDWAGSIAGYKRGLHRERGQALLVLEEADIPDASPGETPVIDGILRQAFPDPDALHVFLGWLKGGVAAIRRGIHQPAPMLVLAGDVNTGKSLLAWIIAQCFGGRIGHPWTAWSGSLPWNDDLVKSELLLIDDNQSSTDIRQRKAFGAKFKEAIYSPEIQVNQRNNSSLSLRPVWRVVVCCNETPENLSVIPPIDSDISDKLILLHFRKAELPVDTSTADGKAELQAMIRTELPAFLAKLDAFEIPEHLHDSRAGVTAWKSPHLTAQLRAIAPEGIMEDLLRQALDSGFLGVERGEEKWMSANEIQARLTEPESPTSGPARSLLRHHTSAGRNLSDLEKNGCDIVTGKKVVNGTARYLIHRPEGGEVE